MPKNAASLRRFFGVGLVEPAERTVLRHPGDGEETAMSETLVLATIGIVSIVAISAMYFRARFKARIPGMHVTTDPSEGSDEDAAAS